MPHLGVFFKTISNKNSEIKAKKIIEIQQSISNNNKIEALLIK